MGRIRCNLRGKNGAEPATGDAAKDSPWTRDEANDEMFGKRVRVNRPEYRNHGATGVISSAPHYLRDDPTPAYRIDYDSGEHRGCSSFVPVDFIDLIFNGATTIADGRST